MTITNKGRLALRQFAATQVTKADGQIKEELATLTQKLDEIDELTGYMEDHINELLSTGKYEEAQAISKTMQDFTIDGENKIKAHSTSDKSAQAYQKYYEKAYTTEKGIATQEVIGLYYGGAILLMLVLGTLLGLILDYWLVGQWLGWVLLIGPIAGILIGAGIGLFQQAKIMRKEMDS